MSEIKTEMTSTKTWWICALVVSFLLGCAVEIDELPSAKGDNEFGQNNKSRWDYVNRPEAFGLPLTRDIDALPLQAEVDLIPWTETYWPALDDSMNVRWQGHHTLSPLEKYDMAFNGWRPPAGFFSLRPLTRESCASGQWDPEYYEQLGPAAKRWSLLKGNGRARNGFDDDGDGQIDECDDFDGMESWWGSCHAWVPASLLELEPLEAVVHNGVRFEVSDVKALLIILYDESRQIAVGERCIQDNPERDAQGRIIDPDCRNTNAGTFHLLMTNMIGLLNRPLGEDRVANREVWNQPISGYRIERQVELSQMEALSLLNLPSDGPYLYNEDAKRFVEVKMVVDYVTESHPSVDATGPMIRDYIRTDTYHYILELSEDGQIIGGEWMPSPVGTSGADRPDYLWIALGTGKQNLPELSELAVRSLHRGSRPETRNHQVASYRSVVNQLIPDWPYEGITNTIKVEDDIFPSKVTVGYSVLHDFIYDLSVKLVRNGQEIALFERQPQGSYTAIVDRREISNFVNENARGDWSLVATDHNGRAIGRFIDWYIEFEQLGQTPQGSTDNSMGTAPTVEATPETEQLEWKAGPVPIPDNDPTGITLALEGQATGSLKNAVVRLEIEHTYVGDLSVSISHGSQEIALWRREGGSRDELTLELQLSEFADTDASGTWQLRIIDSAAIDEGRLLSWSITTELN